MSTKKTLRSKLKKLITQTDIFGYPITLTYKD